MVRVQDVEPAFVCVCLTAWLVMQAIETLTKDIVHVWEFLSANYVQPAAHGYDANRRLVLVGHSLGGSIISHLAHDPRIAASLGIHLGENC